MAILSGDYDLFVLKNQWRMAVCEFGAIKGLLYKEKSVPKEIMAIFEFGVIKRGDRSGKNCIVHFNVLNKINTPKQVEAIRDDANRKLKKSEVTT